MEIKVNYIEEYQKLLDALKGVLTPLETSPLATISLLVQQKSIIGYTMAEGGYNTRLFEVLLAPDDWHEKGHCFYLIQNSKKLGSKVKYKGLNHRTSTRLLQYSKSLMMTLLSC